MAQYVEPMDIDSSVCDFDDKENAFHHNNAVPRSRTPCTEKGYEELDVSELNMKLRYSVTPAASPMSKSYTGNYFDNKNCESDNNIDSENGNMTRSLHTTLSKNDTPIRAHKTLPLHILPSDHGQIGDGNRNVLRPLDTTVTANNITVTVSVPNDIDDNISLPSSSSSMAHTPEATTPTKEIPKGDGGSPIIRGLKSVLNMFRPSQSPIPGEDELAKLETLSPPIVHSPNTTDNQAVLASTPLVGQKTKDPLAKRNSPNRDSLVFNEDLEKELEWQEDSTIIFSNERIPIQKLFFEEPKSLKKSVTKQGQEPNLDETVEYMDVSYNDSGIMDKTATKLSQSIKSEFANTESDSEFVDCESTFTKNASFKSQEELDSTEDVLSHIHNLVEPKSLNASATTLNEFEDKSTNLSSASTETIKVSSEALPIQKNTKHELQNIVIQADDEIKADKDKLSTNVEEVPVAINANNEVNMANHPVVETLGVKSLSQIPLIADPRVLLFNIPSVLEENKNEDSIERDLRITYPADIPLPEDDDMPSLPVMNTELENISQTLDKIAEEIPNINQSEIHTTISKTDLNDDNIILPELPLAAKTDLLENSRSHLVNCPEEKALANKDDLKLVEDIKVNHPATTEMQSEAKSDFPVPISVKGSVPVSCPTEILNEIFFAIPTEISVDVNMQEPNAAETNTEIMKTIPFETQTDLKLVEDFKVDLPATAERQTEDKSVLSVSISGESNVPVSCTTELLTEKNIVEASTEIINTVLIETQAAPDYSDTHVVTEHFNQNESEELDKPVDITIADKEVATDLNKSKVLNTEVVNVNSSIHESANKPEITKPKELFNDKVNTDDIDKVGNEVKTEAAISPNNCEPFLNEFEKFESKSATTNQFAERNIEFIRQEVEAIVAKAVDIAIEKTNACMKDSEAVIGNNENSDIIKTTTANNLVSDQADLTKELLNSFSNEINTTDSVNKTVFISHENEANAQQLLLNQLSDNKYNYTVQDNISAKSVENIQTQDNIILSDQISVDTEKLVSDEIVCKIESPILLIDTSTNNLTINNVANTDFKNSAAKEMDALIQPEAITKEDDSTNTTPSDMEKIEPDAIVDEEIITSGNNSPFVSVSHEIEDIVEVKPMENLEGVENSFATNTKINKTPLPSPKIESKGYNFNFDEIDDPFATKTKIRLSPAPEASPIQNFDQINVEQELPKREFNKNRRKSQPGRRKPAANNKKLNSTFVGKTVKDTKAIAVKVTLPSVTNNNIEPQHSLSKDLNQEVGELQTIVTTETLDIIEKVKDISKKEEQKLPTESDSVPSDETIAAELLEKIPDLDDPNFNPFEAKSKIRFSPPPEKNINPFASRSRIFQTPPPSFDDEDPFATKSKIRISPDTALPPLISRETKIPATCTDFNIDKNQDDIDITSTDTRMEQTVSFEATTVKLEHVEEKESTENTSGTTFSSINDKDSTVREVNTEDEDTVEGPFLEADDLQNDEKMSDFDGENVDMMHFSDLPPGNEENPEAGEFFIDAEAFEFLLNQNKDNMVIDSGKESLFLKFDPLFAKRVSSDGVMAALKQVQTRAKQSTPQKKHSPIQQDATFDKSNVIRDSPLRSDATFNKSPALPGPSGLNATQEIDFNSTAEASFEDPNVTVSKPMMVVNPAVNPIVTPRNKTITPIRSNRQSLTFTSPAIAVIDRLLSMSAGNNSMYGHDTTLAEIHRDNEADLALTQLRELLADKEISVYNLRSESKELQSRLATLESQMKSLEAISEERLKKINELNEKLNEKAKINKNMAQVVEEYERTIASLIAETEQDKKRHAEERLQLIKERDEQTAHLTSMEVSFSDLHSKYEKSKQVILGFKANEDAYKKSIKEFEENLAKMHTNYELLKQHATSKLNHANEQLQQINRAHESEVLKMNTLLKRKELHITSLEETLQQKTKANEELTAICDELINKVG